MSHIFTSDVSEDREKAQNLRECRRGLDPGLGEGSDGGINTLEGQGPKGSGSMRMGLDHQEAKCGRVWLLQGLGGVESANGIPEKREDYLKVT